MKSELRLVLLLLKASDDCGSALSFKANQPIATALDSIVEAAWRHAMAPVNSLAFTASLG